MGHIFDELAPRLAWDGPPRASLETPKVDLTQHEARILALLDDAPASPDRLCAELRLDVGAVALALSRLEVRGLTLRRGVGYEITTAGARARAGPIRTPGD